MRARFKLNRRAARNVHGIAFAQFEWLAADCNLYLARKTDQGSLLLAVLKLHFWSVLVENGARVAQMLHRAVRRSNKDFAPFMRVCLAKHIALARNPLVQNGR